MNAKAPFLLFLLPIAAGAILRRIKMLDRPFSILRVLTIWIILPLIAFVYVGSITVGELRVLSGSVILAVMGVGACFFLSCALALHMAKEDALSLILNSSFMNVAHLGLPVVYSKLGEEYITPAVIYGISVAILNLFIGTLLMYLSSTRESRLREIFFQTFTFPAVSLLLVALLFVYFRAPIPSDLRNFFDERVSPIFFILLLLQVGYHLKVSQPRKYMRLILATGVLRLVVCPLVTLFCGRILALSPEGAVMKSSLLLSMMPPASFNLILVQSFGLDTERYSTVFFFLTLATLIALPFL